MAASQVVLYFDNQQDALLFTLAASSVLSEGPVRTHDAVKKIADEIATAEAIMAAPDSDADMRRYAEEELASLRPKQQVLQDRLEELFENVIESRQARVQTGVRHE